MKTPEKPIHPFAAIFPPMGAAAASLLRERLQKSGQREEIVLLDGQILDGVNRQRELIALGMTPLYREYDPASDGPNPFDFVWDKNFARRQLTASQTSAVIAARTKVLAEYGTKTESVEAAAAAHGVAASTVHAADRIQKADPELFEHVKAGDISVHAATQQIKAAEKAEHQPAPEPGQAVTNVVVFPTSAGTEGTSIDTPPKATVNGGGIVTTGETADGVTTAIEGEAPAKPKGKKGKGKATPPAEGSAPPAAAPKAPKTPSEEAAAKNAEERKKLAGEMVETVKHLHGEEFAKSMQRGAVLKTLKELKAFHKCNDSEQTLVLPYVVQGWEVARATKFVVKSIDPKDPIQDLIFRFTASGEKKTVFKLNGHKITVEKA